MSGAHASLMARSLSARARPRYLRWMITIRPAKASDQDALGRYGGALMRQHHAADEKRFIHVANPEPGYGKFLVSRIPDPDSLVVVAEDEGAVVGYLFANGFINQDIGYASAVGWVLVLMISLVAAAQLKGVRMKAEG